MAEEAAGIASRTLEASVELRCVFGTFVFRIATRNMEVTEGLLGFAVGSVFVGIGALWAASNQARSYISPRLRNAFGGENNDQDMGEPRTGSLLVPIRCFTHERFLEVLADYESGETKRRLEKELEQVGLKLEGLTVEIENMDEVNKKRTAIYERKLNMTTIKTATEDYLVETDKSLLSTSGNKDEFKDKLDLIDPFNSYNDCEKFTIKQVLPILKRANSAGVSLLALQGLWCIEEKVQKNQFKSSEVLVEMRKFLRSWRCRSRPKGNYIKLTENVLRSLTIFQGFDVPLFIDDYGKKNFMCDYDKNENIDIDLKKTPIVHVTHLEEKEKIVFEEKFQPSDNKNIIKGTWFSLKDKLIQSNGELQSNYGNWAFETTLEKLGVQSLHQGEIISYKREVNFILYASDEPTEQVVLRKATDDALKHVHGENAYAAVSIFVPSSLIKEKSLPDLLTEEPYNVSHANLCVKKLRSNDGWTCPLIG